MSSSSAICSAAVPGGPASRQHGGWRYRRRAEILALLTASDGPLSPRQIARTLGKQRSAISMLLAKMVRDGDLTLARYGKYTPTDSTDSTDSADSFSLREPMKKNHPLFKMVQSQQSQ